jgi:hypothetical protein
VRQNLSAQKLLKSMATDQENIELLGRRVQELRGCLATRTEFARLEPGTRDRGLRPAHGEQVLAVATGEMAGAASEPATDLTSRMVADLVEFLGPQAAQAEARGTGASEPAEGTFAGRDRTPAKGAGQ